MTCPLYDSFRLRGVAEDKIQAIRRLRNGMMARCYNRAHDNYPNYGGRGIYVCYDWRTDPPSFMQWSLLNAFAFNKTIDREDNDGPYSPMNCRFVDGLTQSNNRRDNVYIENQGVAKTLSEWCRHLRLSDTQTATVYSRHAINPSRSFDELFSETDIYPGWASRALVTRKQKTQSLREWCLEHGLNTKQRQKIYQRYMRQPFLNYEELFTPLHLNDFRKQQEEASNA